MSRRLRLAGVLTGLSVAAALAAGEYQLLRVGSPQLALVLLALLTATAAAVAVRSRPVLTL